MALAVLRDVLVAMNIKVLKNVLEANDQCAARIRADLTSRKITSINVISAPGAGKTSLLEKTIPMLQSRFRIGVLEGDIATTRDGDRIGKLGVPVVQLLTGGACHLEAPLVQRGLGELELEKLNLVFIENVGNIACPAEFDLGENAKVGVLSVAEGHDKPAKYPLLFHEVSALVLNKVDLLPYCDFDYETFLADFRKLNAKAPVFKLSCKTGEGLDAWTHWLEHVAEGEIHVHPHTHEAVEGIQPHTHPHKH
jgi:hydrogenase nickel incorporation protein HypB